MLQLLKQEVSQEERRQYTDMAYDAGTRLLSLLNDILDFSKIEAGQLHFAHEEVSLTDLIANVVDVFRPTTEGKGLELSVEVDPSVPEELLGDDARIRQILFNLVGNAIKFTPSGSVSVKAWSHPSKRFQGKTRLYISVSDTGIGIPDDKQAYVFQRFTQSDASYTRHYEGAGLGLAIVKRLVTFMDGDITVDSEVGVGTTVYLHFLLDNAIREKSHDSDKKPSLSDSPSTLLRILIADDEPIGQMSLQVMLGRVGHKVVTANNGEEALSALLRDDFDVILMDVQMPQMDGVEATRIIRSMPELGGKQKIPIIALTAYAMIGDREKFLAVGMDEHVAKPVQVEELKKALERVVEKRQ